MLIKNLNPLFQLPEIEGKYLSLLGITGALPFYVAMQLNLSLFVLLTLVALFPVFAFLMYGRMAEELADETKIRKDYILFIKVRFWSFVTLILFSMLFVFGLEYFI